MSADTIIIEPDDFEEQKEKYHKASSDVASIYVTAECQDVCLRSVTRFQDCINLLNKTISTLSALLEYDCADLDQIMEDWKHLDTKQAVHIANMSGSSNSESGNGERSS